jgi:hypothetical protein
MSDTSDFEGAEFEERHDMGDKVWVKNLELTPFVLIEENQVIGEGVQHSDGTLTVHWVRINITEHFRDRDHMFMHEYGVKMHIGQPFRYTTMEPRS